MKALSLWQPWATLIAIGVKKIETRSWATSYRGPLLICSAKRPLDRKTREWMDRSSLFRAALRKEQPMGLELTIERVKETVQNVREARALVERVLFGDDVAKQFKKRREKR